MSDKDKDLSLEDLGDLGELEITHSNHQTEEGLGEELDLSLEDGEELELADPDAEEGEEDDLELEEGEEEEVLEEDSGLSLNMGELDLSIDEAPPLDAPEDSSNDLSLSAYMPPKEELEPVADLTLDAGNDLDVGLDLSDDALDLSLENNDVSLDLSADENESPLGSDVSPEVLTKLQEIDQIMEMDASQVSMNAGPALQELNQLESGTDPSIQVGGLDLGLDSPEGLPEIPEQKVREPSIKSVKEPAGKLLLDSDLNEPLVSDDLNLDGIDFSSNEEVDEEEVTRVEKIEKPRRKKKEVVQEDGDDDQDQDYSRGLKEISGAYSGELERTQATIANLRADREELLKKIQTLEESAVLSNRQTLSLRAELDEKKIELTIIRKKLNEEISDLKDRLRVQEERRLILEEKNKVLAQELDKAGQKNKLDVKRVQMRERELEQKLELLKADAETQIRNRDLKILELKRKIDAMEFDMESISQQEKKSVESRFELEDKLDKAIKTLRSAISVLEEDGERGSALEALKKNIDM